MIEQKGLQPDKKANTSWRGSELENLMSPGDNDFSLDTTCLPWWQAQSCLALVCPPIIQESCPTELKTDVSSGPETQHL